MAYQTLLHADWSKAAAKRWFAKSIRNAQGWEVSAPTLVGDSRGFVDALWTTPGPVLAGFDFPIGLPRTYGEKTGFKDFPAALDAFGTGEWADFFFVAHTPEQISRTRPFYPMQSTDAASQGHLLSALQVPDVNTLRRRCELATPTRPAACPLFWTLGGNQVGKAAIAGWQEIVIPARARGARLWPFDGPLDALAAGTAPVLAETYPAEAYRHVGVSFAPRASKRRQPDRIDAMHGLLNWARSNRVTFTPTLLQQLADGFGSTSSGEDRFDALIGLLGMIEVVDGRRAAHPGHGREVDWEGWILGQAA